LIIADFQADDPGGTFTFDYWGHTEGGKLTLGSGLFVGPTGVVCDHHFNPRRSAQHSQDFRFVAGRYRIEVIAADIRRSKPDRLMELTFTVDGQQAAELLLQITDTALNLHWNADSCAYEGESRAPATTAGFAT
jgi:hypothetical protein